jgi:hypothetical protein
MKKSKDSKKTTAKHFNHFKTCFLKYQKLFGLIHYNVYFNHKPIKNSYANIIVDEDHKVATVTFASVWPDRLVINDEINKCALHEVCHLMISRLRWMATCRYLGEAEILEEDEALTVRLESILCNKFK